MKDRPTDRATNQRTDKRAHREVTILISSLDLLALRSYGTEQSRERVREGEKEEVVVYYRVK